MMNIGADIITNTILGGGPDYRYLFLDPKALV